MQDPSSDITLISEKKPSSIKMGAVSVMTTAGPMSTALTIYIPDQIADGHLSRRKAFSISTEDRTAIGLPEIIF